MIFRREIVVLLATILLSCRSVAAQTIVGSVFGGLGAFKCCDGSVGAVDLGAGVDLPLWGVLAINSEFGIVDSIGSGTIQTTSGSVIFGRVKVFSVDALIHFDVQAHRRLKPFVKGGFDLTGAGDVGGANANVGSGFDWWLDERCGLRIEVRDDMFREFGTTHVILVRAGVIFR